MRKLINRLMEYMESIQFTITISFICIAGIAMIGTGDLVYNKFYNTSKSNTQISVNQLMDETKHNMEKYTYRMIKISNYLSKKIENSNQGSMTNIQNYMDIIGGTKDDIVSLCLFSKQGKIVASYPNHTLKSWIDVKKQGWFKNSIKNDSSIYISPSHVENLFPRSYNWVVSIGSKVPFEENYKKQTGVLLLNMNFSFIDEICRGVSLGKKGYIYIIDQKGNIIYHPRQELINTGLENENISFIKNYNNKSYINNGRLITVKKLDYTNWSIVGVYYMDEIIGNSNDITIYLVWVIVSAALIVIIISAIFSAKITQPIKKLQKSMKKLENGDMNVSICIDGNDEVAKLSHSFNVMVKRLKELMKQIVIEQEETRKQEYEVLQSQINPHFLYNILDSIVWMAENGKANEVITMTTALAKLFRISLSKGKNIITVENEIEHAKYYLVIQKIRYKNKFEYSINLSDEVKILKVPKLILQPIIENSLYHGIEYLVDEGFIEISAEISNEMLIFKVKDNGVGMSEDIVENVLIREIKSSKGSGIGIKNVHDRIQLMYGKEYGIEIESEIEEGTTITLKLPIQR
jgi:two-component system sensor histidine kinase YesM